jgi:hypothetical protein
MTFSAVLSLFGLAPKTLPQAQAAFETVKGTLDSVNALFVAAGLNLEQMLTAGPDALKAHIASVSAADGALATAQTKVTDLEGKLNAANQRVEASSALLTAIGATAETKPEDFKALLATHVKEQAALELAKTGHNPVAIQPATTPGVAAVVPSANASRQEHYAYMATLPEKEQSEYYRKHIGNISK